MFILMPTAGTQLLTNSQSLTESEWTKTACSADVTPVINPVGGIGSAILVEDSSMSTHVAAQNVTLEDNTLYIVCTLAKSVDRNCSLAVVSKANTFSFIRVNLSTGDIMNVTGSPLNYFVIPLPDDWYYIGFVFDSQSGETQPLVALYMATTVNNYTGDGASLVMFFDTFVATFTGLSETITWTDAVSNAIHGFLSVTPTDDLDNWTDILNGQLNSFLTVTDNLNSWSDAFNGLFHTNFHGFDNVNSWQDQVGLLYALSANVSSTMSLSDAVLLHLMGNFAAVVTDDLDEWTDIFEGLGQHRAHLFDTINIWNDNIEAFQGFLEHVFSQMPDWEDDVAAHYVAIILEHAFSNLDNWTDDTTNSFLSRLSASKRGHLIPYIRRYLNDVEEPVIGELRVSVGDSMANWSDGV
jgi:hypothetical protein